MKKIQVSKPFTKGIAISRAFLMKEISWKAENTQISGNIEEEAARYHSAVRQAEGDLQSLAEKNPIWGAHLSLVHDPVLTEEVLVKIQTEKKNAELALEETIQFYEEIFASMDDEYMRERGADIKDVGKRIMLKLQGKENASLADLRSPAIVIARDLAPSDTANMNPDLVRGFITEEGGTTSHVAIMAKMYGIPALVGAGPLLDKIEDGDLIALDAQTGEIVVCPDRETLNIYTEKQKEYEAEKERLQTSLLLPSVTRDGHVVEVSANVGSINDIQNALDAHAEGIGLFRTEFLYMQNSHFPTEEEQFQIYKEAACLMGEKELTIRTLDIGGDKDLSYFDFGAEDNPFLGYRAIRICLDRQDIFRTQLRALLRAGVYGNIRIMYPMIISLEELRKANALLEQCKLELEAEKIPYRKDIPAGMMIETPASVVCADLFARETGFFSIGTNDLTQYTLAVDRGNKKISHMYDAFHPAVLRNIFHSIQEAHKAGIKAGMCGEFAGDPRAIRLLLGMGLDEFSMSAGSMAEAKAIIRSVSYEECQKYAHKILSCSTVEEIHAILE